MLDVPAFRYHVVAVLLAAPVNDVPSCPNLSDVPASVPISSSLAAFCVPSGEMVELSVTVTSAVVQAAFSNSSEEY